jgi:hypothetical protein
MAEELGSRPDGWANRDLDIGAVSDRHRRHPPTPAAVAAARSRSRLRADGRNHRVAVVCARVEAMASS